jgi:O-antigen/teichoic acid export membrane protein
MQQRFFRNLAFLLSLNLLIKPFWILGIDRAVQNAVGESDYGLYLSVYSYSFLFFILLDLGITNFNNRNIAQNNQLLSKHFAGIASTKLLLALLYSVVTFSVGWMIGYKAEQLHLLAWVGFNQIILSFILYLRSNISGLMLFKADSLFSVLDRLVMIFICGILLWSGWVTGPFQIMWFVYAQTFAFAITFLAALVFLMRHVGKLTINFNPAFMITIIKRGLPYALLVLLMSFYNRLEPVLIERLLPEEAGLIQTGIYGKAFRLLDAGNNISLLFSVLLLPMFASMLKRKEPINQLTRLSFSLILTMSVLTAGIALTYSKEIMELLYGIRAGEDVHVFNSRISESSMILRILMGSFVSVSITYIFGTLLTANGNLKALNIVAGTGVLVNVLMNAILIPRFEAVGAAWASFGVQGLTAMIQMVIAFRVFHLRFGRLFWWRLIEFLIFFAMAVGLSTVLPLPWFVNMLLAAIAGLAISFATRMIGLNEIKDLVLWTAQSRRK